MSNHKIAATLKAVERELMDPDVADKDIREATLRIVRKGLQSAETPHRTMRAKLQVGSITTYRESYADNTGAVTQEQLQMHAVCATFDGNGHSDDNDYARYSPGASLSISIANPALFGKFKVGDKFYVDFIAAAE